MEPIHTLNPNDIEKLFQHLSITNSEEEEEEEEHVVDDSDEEEEFSFMSLGADTSPLEDALMDGEMIKPVFPLFNMPSTQDLPIQPHVHKVFIEMRTDRDEISGPYCDLSNRKVVKVDNSELDGCKKSNSTGFSKIWRLKDLIGRSNSEGRDAFVFLDKATVVNVEKKMKKANKSKTSSSSHEVYLKRRAKDKKRPRPSYLPYRPELMGFFTSVNGGGLTRNVHPY